MLNEFETKIELAGEGYNALVSYEWDDQRPIIYSVEITRVIHHDYNKRGEYAPEVERIVLDITRFLDDYQVGGLMEEISEDTAEGNSYEIPS